MTDITKNIQKNTCCLGEGSCYESLFFPFETIWNTSQTSISTSKNGLPSPSGSPRTSHPRLHPCYVRRRPTDRSQFLCFFPVQPKNGWFHPKELVGFWDGFFWCFSVLFRKWKGGIFRFPGPFVFYIISPWLWPRESWGMSDGKTMHRKRLIINGQEISLQHIAT